VGLDATASASKVPGWRTKESEKVRGWGGIPTASALRYAEETAAGAAGMVGRPVAALTYQRRASKAQTNPAFGTEGKGDIQIVAEDRVIEPPEEAGMERMTAPPLLKAGVAPAKDKLPQASTAAAAVVAATAGESNDARK
jgi:hypothetical protein